MDSLMKHIKKVAGLINSLAALHLGLSALGYNIFSYPMILDRFGWALPYINYAFGVSGLVFLVMWVMCCVSCSSCCSSGSHGCGSCGVMNKH